jgi:thiamine biosynthesis lipoprotein
MLLPAARELLVAELAAVDAACSTFRGESELAAVNAAGRRGGGPVRISPLLADAIGAALRAAELTGGDVDPVAGPGMLRVSSAPAAGPTRGDVDPVAGPGMLRVSSAPAAGQTSCDVDRVTRPGMFRASSAQAARQAGGDTDMGAGPASTVSGTPVAAGWQAAAWMTRPADPARITVVTSASWRHVRLDRESGLLTLPPGSWLDLGATAWAWAADRAAAAIAARLRCGVLVSLGGDCAAGGEAPPGGWRIRVQDSARTTGAGEPVSGRPAAPLSAAPAAVVSIQHGGLATAGAGAGRWHRAGDVLAHMLRPRGTSLPSAPWRLASVSAVSCLEARAASVSAIIMGNDAIGWLAGLGLPARLVDDAGQVRTVGGWPADRAVPSAAPAAVIPVGRPAAVIPVGCAPAAVIPVGCAPAAVIPVGRAHGAAAACPSVSGSGGSGEAAGR